MQHETVGATRKSCAHPGLDVQIRVGLNSGEVVVRAIDNDLHMATRPSARPPTWRRAWSSSRVPHHVLSRDTLRLRRLHRGAPAGPVPVKGLPVPWRSTS